MFIIKKRTSGKINSDIKTPDLYKYYINNIKPIESFLGNKTIGSFDINQKEYSEILKDINREIIKTIIIENFEFKMPLALGIITVMQKKLNFAFNKNGELIYKQHAVNYKALKDLWSKDDDAKNQRILIYHTNEHTNGNKMRFAWDKRKTNKVFGIRTYYFVPCRSVKRQLANYLKDENLKLSFFETKKKRISKNNIIYNNLPKGL